MDGQSSFFSYGFFGGHPNEPQFSRGAETILRFPYLLSAKGNGEKLFRNNVILFCAKAFVVGGRKNGIFLEKIFPPTSNSHMRVKIFPIFLATISPFTTLFSRPPPHTVSRKSWPSAKGRERRKGYFLLLFHALGGRRQRCVLRRRKKNV